MGWGERFREGLKKTRLNLIGLFTGAHIDEDFYDTLEEALIGSDMGVAASVGLLEELREAVAKKGLKTPEEAKLALRDIIAARLAPLEKSPDFSKKPTVIMLCGVNGAGKTTTIGKLTRRLSGEGKKVILGAGDTFRAAAREQLIAWGKKNNVDVISGSTDPAATAFDAVRAGVDKGADVVIVDTAGRLATQTRLMQELSRVQRVQGKALAGAPHETILVLDGTNGLNALNQVQAFDMSCPLTGLIVTKLDGSAKGGALVALAELRKSRPLPVYYVGVGEKIEDLADFDAKAFASALLGIE